MLGNRIKLDDELFDKVKKCAAIAGYSSPEEFVVHVLEKEVAAILGSGPESDDEEAVRKRLKGLGYIECRMLVGGLMAAQGNHQGRPYDESWVRRCFSEAGRWRIQSFLLALSRCPSRLRVDRHLVLDRLGCGPGFPLCFEPGRLAPNQESHPSPPVGASPLPGPVGDRFACSWPHPPLDTRLPCL